MRKPAPKRNKNNAANEPIYIDAPQVLIRFGGRSFMWLHRRLERDPTFPRPIKVGRLRFWKVADLVAWEREAAAKSAA